MKKILGPLLTLLLLGGVSLAIYLSVREQLGDLGIVPLRGLIGSEKEEFFRDPRVVTVLRKNGFSVQVQKAGSRQIATLPNLREFDFAFPAGIPAAEKIKREQQINRSHPVFFTPMAVASWKLIAGILEANGMVQRRDGVYYIIDMSRLLNLTLQEKRWSDLPNNEGYAVNKSILITTTDVRNSNSAAMYLALASYLLNRHNIITTEAQVEPLIDRLGSLFLRQGYLESSSATPFNDYLVMGPGKAPLVMIYESQFLYEAARPNSGLNDEMVLLYPEPTLFTKHILVPFNDNADKLGELLEQDPELQELAIEHGFRNSDSKGFRSFVNSHQLAVPEPLVHVIDAPTYEILERMISRIEQSYTGEPR
jgi:hypothetical protein